MGEHMLRVLASDGSVLAPSWDERGVPSCSEDDCPAYDGKRCSIMGFRPARLCEPSVREMAAHLGLADAEPFDDPVKLDVVDNRTAIVRPSQVAAVVSNWGSGAVVHLKCHHELHVMDYLTTVRALGFAQRDEDAV